MKTFESLFAELSEKAATKQAGSLTVDELAKGTHFIGKKIVEEAGETWIAAEYEGADRTAEEMSQLIYQYYLWFTFQDTIKIHFRKSFPFIFYKSSLNLFQTFHQCKCFFPAMRFNVTYNNINTFFFIGQCSAEH